MTLRQFLNAGFALLVEAYTGLGVNIVEAVERAWDALGIEQSQPMKEAREGAQNAAAVAQLNQMMAGLK